jgi:hypothetical protein
MPVRVPPGVAVPGDAAVGIVVAALGAALVPRQAVAAKTGGAPLTLAVTAAVWGPVHSAAMVAVPLSIMSVVHAGPATASAAVLATALALVNRYVN